MKKMVPSLLAFALIAIAGLTLSSTVQAATTTTGSKLAHVFHNGSRTHTPDPQKKADMQAKMRASQASILGISVDDLTARLAQGKTYAQIAQDLGITSDQLKTRQQAQRQQMMDQMVADMKTKIQARVTSGKLTQAEADKRIARLSTFSKQGFGMGFYAGFQAKKGIGHHLKTQK